MTSKEREATRRMWLDKVASIRDTLMAHADYAETHGTLAQPAVNALRDAGFFHLRLPSELGGAEADQILVMEVVEALSYIQPSSGWCATIGAGSASMAGAYLCDEGANRVFGQGTAVIMAGSFFPAGTATPVDGGYQVSGRWRFASGVRHADWVQAGAIVAHNQDGNSRHDDGPPEVIQVIVPASDIRIHDNWHVMGLRGSGSCDFSIEDLFVPATLTYVVDRVAPQPQRGGNRFRIGRPAFLADDHIGLALGIARRALDELTVMATTTRGRFRPTALADREIVHRFVGMADIKLRAVRALALELFEEIRQTVERGDAAGSLLQTRSHAAGTYATDLAVEIATQAFRYGGAGALFQPNMLELLLRDINAAAQHVFASDSAYEDYGKCLLGLGG
jgi:indole-3-acetate monooxygenase